MISRLSGFVILLVVLVGCGAPVPGEASPQPEIVAEVPPPAVVAPILNPVRMDIPAIGVTDELVPVGLGADGSMEIPDVHETGVYEQAPMPGEQGPAVLASHVNWDGTPGAFQRLHELKPGDHITITGDDGHQLTFDVYRVSTFPKATFDFSIYADTEAPELRAVTCGGDVVDHSYTDNVVAWARLLP